MMNKPLSERYAHYDATGASKWQPLVLSGPEKTASSLVKYESHLANEYQMTPGQSVEASAEDEALAGMAVEFIERVTGLPVTCSMGLYTYLRETTPTDSTFAAYDGPLHRIAVRAYDRTMAEYERMLFVGGILVHELMHSTMVDTAKVVDIQDGDEHDLHTLMPHHVGDVTPSFTGDSFFEEGLAEEIASRWREEFDTTLLHRRRDLLSTLGAAAIPVRMYAPARPIDETVFDEEHMHIYGAYCSFGIQLLSEHTGVDLIDLLIQARKPATQTHASRALKEVMDSVEPGLYDVLTSAEYTYADFADCLEIIKQAIANDAHAQYDAIVK